MMKFPPVGGKKPKDGDGDLKVGEKAKAMPKMAPTEVPMDKVDKLPGAPKKAQKGFKSVDDLRAFGKKKFGL